MSLEDEILDWGVLDRQKSGGILDGEVLYCLLVSLRRWRSNPLLVCQLCSIGVHSTDRSPEAFLLLFEIVSTELSC